MSDSENDKTIVLGGAAGVPLNPAPVPVPAAQSGGSHNDLPFNTRLGEFEIVGLVGEGGFGIVYLAYDHSLERKVALKEYMPASLASRGPNAQVSVRSERHRETFEVGRRSFVNEARLLAQFDHPALVKVYRFWEDNGTAYMAMPFYDGVTLSDALKARTTPPDESWIHKILTPVMEALEVIHAENCFHRDIAPDNIMLLRDERPVLLDFGAARRVIGDMTQALTVILKPGYAPVEQYAEMPDMKQGAWTDIYALAAVVYFMITGRTPPPSVGRLMNDTYQPLTQLAAGRFGDGFLRGIDHCLAVKAAERPQSVAAMRRAIGLVGFDAPPLYAPVPPSTKAPHAGEMVDDLTQMIPQAHAVVYSPGQSQSVIVPPPQVRPTSTSPAGKLPVKQPGIKKALGLAMGGGALMMAAIGAFVLSSGPDKSPVTPVASSTPAAPETPTPVSPPPVASPQPAPTLSAVSWKIAVQDTLAAATRPIVVDRVKTPVVVGKDALSFALKSERNGFVYLYLLDRAENKLNLIFPNALDTNNHIVAHKIMSFPREAWSFSADMPLGEWEVLVMVADTKRDFTGLDLVAKDGISSAPLDKLETALGRLVPGALAGMPKCAAEEAHCASDYGAQFFKIIESKAPGKR